MARRLATVAIGTIVVLVVISLAVGPVGLGVLIPSSRLLSWQVNDGGVGSNDPTAAQTTTVVTIEVEHPGCTPSSGDRSWLADPIISYTPWTVTITMHMNDTPATAGCSSRQAPHDGQLPIVGGYLTGIFYPVQLGEPLGGRTLLDGSSFPPQARPYH